MLPTNRSSDFRPACGELLRRYRLLAGLSQAELADQIGYSTDYLGKLERGRRLPPADMLTRIARTLRLSDGQLAELRAARTAATDAAAGLAPLAGRERELDDVRALLSGSGEVSLLMFSGEPGIGKTRMLDEAARLGQRAGWRVVRGTCLPRRDDSWAPFTEALSATLRILPDDRRREALSAAPYLRLLLPELPAAGDAAGDLDPGSDAAVAQGLRAAEGTVGAQPDLGRRLLLASVSDYLAAIAGDAGTLLVLDDLQWANQDALELITAVTGERRRGPDHRIQVRVVGAFRDTEGLAGAPLGSFVTELARSASARVRELSLLSETESAALLDSMLSTGEGRSGPSLKAAIRRSGGMPLFLVSFADELRNAGRAPAEGEVPWSVAQAVRARVEALEPETRELLAVASLGSGAAVPELLARATGRDIEHVLDALAQACDARLLIDQEDGCHFVHELVRETVSGELSSGWRRLWYQRLAAALIDLPERRLSGRAAAIAWYLQQGDDPELTLEWTLRAGDEAAASFGYVAAADRYRTAAEQAAALGDAEREAFAADRLGDMLRRLGLYQDAITWLERAAALYTDLGRRGDHLAAVAQSAEMYHMGGRVNDGLARLLPVIEALTDDDLNGDAAASAAQSYAVLCGMQLSALRVTEAITSAETAIALGTASGNLRAVCTAGLCRGLALGGLGRRDEQLVAYGDALRVAEQLDDPWRLAAALSVNAEAHAAAGRLAEGERMIRRALAIAHAAGQDVPAAVIRATLAELLLLRGAWHAARDEAEQAHADSLMLGARPGHMVVLAALGHVLLALGERDAGLARLHEGLEVAAALNYPAGAIKLSELLAWQHLRDGAPQAAIAQLEPIFEARRQAGHGWYPAVFAQALIEAGDLPRAQGLLESARAAACAGAATPTPELLRVCAELAIKQEHFDEARDDIAAGLRTAVAHGLPYERALLLESDARLRASLGDADGARTRRSEALKIFTALGAQQDIARLVGFR